jgi:hypothetical protein
MMRGITKGSPELSKPSTWRRLQELDERYSNWCDLATHVRAEMIASERNMRTAREQREHLSRLAELIKKDTDLLSDFARELADILLGRELEEPLVVLSKRTLASKPLTVGVRSTLDRNWTMRGGSMH